MEDVTLVSVCHCRLGYPHKFTFFLSIYKLKLTYRCQQIWAFSALFLKEIVAFKEIFLRPSVLFSPQTCHARLHPPLPSYCMLHLWCHFLPYQILLTHSRFIEACDSQSVQFDWRDYVFTLGGGRKERYKRPPPIFLTTNCSFLFLLYLYYIKIF